MAKSSSLRIKLDRFLPGDLKMPLACNVSFQYFGRLRIPVLNHAIIQWLNVVEHNSNKVGCLDNMERHTRFDQCIPHHLTDRLPNANKVIISTLTPKDFQTFQTRGGGDGLPDSVPSCINHLSAPTSDLSKCAMISRRPTIAANGKPPPITLPSVVTSGVTP